MRNEIQKRKNKNLHTYSERERESDLQFIKFTWCELVTMVFSGDKFLLCGFSVYVDFI